MVAAAKLVVPLALALGGLLLVVPAAATPPADAFCVITIQGLDGFRVVRYTIDEETNLTQREALWPSVDTDRDGEIVPAEADAFRRSQVRLWNSRMDGLGVKAVRLSTEDEPSNASAQPAVYTATWREIGHTFHQRDYQLPETIVEAADLETQEVREFRFHVRSTPDRVTIYGGINLDPPPSRVVIEYVVVRAPENWTVESVTGHTYNGTFAAEYETAVVDIPAFDTKQPYSITFVRDDAAAVGIPLPAFVALGALATALWTARRRMRA